MEEIDVDAPPQSHRGSINISAKPSETFLGKKLWQQSSLILLCCHNDCFERFDLLFFKEIFYLICRKPPRGGGRTLSSERLPVTAQSRDKPLFYFTSYLLCGLMAQKDLTPLLLSASEVKHRACSLAVTSRKFGTFLK